MRRGGANRHTGSRSATLRHGQVGGKVGEAEHRKGCLARGAGHCPEVNGSVPGRTLIVAEDPVIWFSGGQYQVLYDYPGDRVGYHLTSTDGIHNWTDQGWPTIPDLAGDRALLITLTKAGERGQA